MFTQNNGMLSSERPKYWQSRLFTTSGTWTVPADVGLIWVDGCGGGSGGGGGHTSDTTGGGGGGGSSGIQFIQYPIPTTPGETLTVTVGAGGIGGAAGADGVNSGKSQIIGTLGGLYMIAGGSGRTGTATTGGASAGQGGDHNNSSTVTGINNSGIGNKNIVDLKIATHSYLPRYVGATDLVYQAGSGGGGPGYNGGSSLHGAALIATPLSSTAGYRYIVSGSGSGTAGSGMGGGGAGGCSFWGDGGVGGNAGVAGGNATGYGAGGGGGGCNAKGGDGSPGFVRIYCLSSFPI